MLMRPPLSPFIAIPKPLPSSPSRLATGTLTFSKTTWRVGWAFQPIFFSFAPNDRPGVSAGTTKAVMPRLPVVGGAGHHDVVARRTLPRR